jgi:hypothetical protein
LAILAHKLAILAHNLAILRILWSKEGC